MKIKIMLFITAALILAAACTPAQYSIYMDWAVPNGAVQPANNAAAEDLWCDTPTIRHSYVPGSVQADMANAGQNPACMRMAQKINDRRSALGKPTLSQNDELAQDSRAHSNWMDNNNNLQHASCLLCEYSGNPNEIGEIIGTGGSIQAIFDAFVASPSHRALIDKAAYDEMGVGIERDGSVWWVTVRFIDS